MHSTIHITFLKVAALILYEQSCTNRIPVCLCNC